MTGSREQILEALRKTASNGADSPTSVEPIPGAVDADHRDLIRQFTSNAEGVSTECRHIATLSEIPGAVAAYLRLHNIPHEITLAPALAHPSIGWDDHRLLRTRVGTAEANDRAAVTLAIAGVAETGTLLLASSPQTPTLLSFLPETSIVILESASIVPIYERAWQLLIDPHGQLPRSANFVTGPSRTGDIGQKLELGAHGPRRLFVIIVDEALPKES